MMIEIGDEVAYPAESGRRAWSYGIVADLPDLLGEEVVIEHPYNGAKITAKSADVVVERTAAEIAGEEE